MISVGILTGGMLLLPVRVGPHFLRENFTQLRQMENSSVISKTNMYCSDICCNHFTAVIMLLTHARIEYWHVINETKVSFLD
jgi:hypothetical protein